MMPEVQKELRLTKQQTKALSTAMYSTSAQAQNDPSSMMGGADFMSGMNERIDANALTTLDDSQRKRLGELWAQYEGPGIWTLKPIADQLNLTEDQRTKAAELVKKCAEDETDMMMHMSRRIGGGKHVQDDMKKLIATRNTELVALLTPDQDKTWTEMQGKPFKFKNPKVM